jgi:hypothetical protein
MVTVILQHGGHSWSSPLAHISPNFNTSLTDQRQCDERSWAVALSATTSHTNSPAKEQMAVMEIKQWMVGCHPKATGMLRVTRRRRDAAASVCRWCSRLGLQLQREWHTHAHTHTQGCAIIVLRWMHAIRALLWLVVVLLWLHANDVRWRLKAHSMPLTTGTWLTWWQCSRRWPPWRLGSER